MIKKLIPHICIILTLLMLTLFILAQFNRISDTPFYKIFMYIFFGVTLITSGLLIAYNRRA